MGCGFSNSSTVVGDPKSPEYQGNVHSFSHGRMGERVSRRRKVEKEGESMRKFKEINRNIDGNRRESLCEMERSFSKKE
jgi:hypothetical protein